jgi:hypothetical protein
LSGTLSDLYIENGDENFIPSSATQLAGGGAAAGLALAGLAGAATNALFVAGGGVDQVQFFTATLSNNRIAGRFSKIWFENGDELEVAAKPQSDGTYAAYAVRRLSDKTLWMFPHCSRGMKPHWRFAWKMAVVFVFSFSAGMNILGISAVGFDDFWSAKVFLLPFGFVNAIVFGCYFALNTARRWKPFVATAEAIFRAFGYQHPETVDMPKQNSLYWKRYAKPEEERKFAPWVFRYVE